MRRSATGDGAAPVLRAGRAGLAAVVLTTGALAGLPPAAAVTPPTIDPAALPSNGTPGPPVPMRQNAFCTQVGVLPGTDFAVPPAYLDMLDLAEAWRFGRGAGVKVAVIDTGVTPHPRLPRLVGGGDYVMGGDGLSDCDAHGTLVASMIAATPAGGPAPEAPLPRRPVPVPTVDPPPPPPKAPPPQTVTVSPLPQTVTVIPGPPPGPVPPDGLMPDGPPPAAPAAPAPPVPDGPPPESAAEVPPPEPGPAVAVPSGYSGGGRILAVDNPATVPDAFTGIAPEAEIIAIRQSSRAFGPRDAYSGGIEDPQARDRVDYVDTMARAIVHAADLGASVINISDVTCMNAREIVDQRALGAAVRYAAVDRNAVIIAAAGDTNRPDCRQNPPPDPLRPADPRGWDSVETVVTPSWFSDYVLTVGAVNLDGRPLTPPDQAQRSTSVAGPWVRIAAPGVDVVGLSPRDDGLVNAIDGPDNTLLVPAGSGFSAAIVSGVAALVRAKFPQLSAEQVVHRLVRTARAPAGGVDNQVGFGVVDPVAALTWDVPEGSAPLPALSAPLSAPQSAPPRDLRPVWVAGVGLLTALLTGAVLAGVPRWANRPGRPR